MCEAHGVMFKVNTIINKYNYEKDMNAAIEAINPKRWRCSRCLPCPKRMVQKDVAGCEGVLDHGRAVEVFL